MENRRPESSAWSRWLGLLVVIAMFVGGSASFLPQQCLWVDEATQMTGLSLGPTGAARWLAGGGPNDTGQVRDRMPPLSYWLGWAWGRVFGFEEASLRWFGVTCVAVAAALVYEAARRALGTAPAWVAGLLFAASPGVIALSVEIRPYPLFLLWSALAFLLLVRLRSEPPDERWTTHAALALALSGAVSTHFFGAVLAGSMLTALFVLALRGEGRVRPIIGVAGVVAVTMALQVPYIVASAAQTKPKITRVVYPVSRLNEVKNMTVSLVKHVTLSVHSPVSIVAVIAAVALIVLAFRVSRSYRRPIVAVALTLGIGLLVITAAKLAQSGFDATSLNYNVWMRPAFCILMSAGVASQSRPARRVAALAFGLLLVAQMSGVYQLAAHGSYFAHGPQRAIVELIHSLKTRDIAVVHDDPSHRNMVVYCPLRYELGSDLEQYQPADATASSTLVSDYPAGREVRQVTPLTHRYLVVVRSEATNPKNLATQLREGNRPLADGPLARALRTSGDWRLISERVTVAAISAKIDLFESSRPPRQTASRREIGSIHDTGRVR